MTDILYIDPNEDRAEEIEKTLLRKDKHIEVVKASDIEEALKEYDRNPVDVVVSREDIDGEPAYNLFEKLESKGSETPFIIFTDKNVDEISITEPTIIADYVDSSRDKATTRLQNHIKNLEKGSGALDYPVPDDEKERVSVFERYRPIKEEEQKALNDLTRRLREHFDVPTAYVGLISRDKEVYISSQGWEESERARCDTVCTFTILDSDVLIIHDLTEDARFKDVDKVQGSELSWYAGIPLKNKDGVKIGALCLMDREDREMTDEEIECLKDFAEEAEDIFVEVRKRSHG